MLDRSLFYLQAPVGNRSYASFGGRSTAAQPCGLEVLEDWSTRWFRSGTMALAAAVKLACDKADAPQKKVLVPGYSCPDLVSAIRHGGAAPVYVDMLPNQTVMDPDLLEQALARNEGVVAIVGVDLFGLPENWSVLRDVADSYGLYLIQDCAQSVQSAGSFVESLCGDAVIFSFGRGKPVCCLTGGVLLLRHEMPGPDAEGLVYRPRFLRTRNTLYNFLISPPIFALLAMAMGSRLGETHYVPLAEVESLSPEAAGELNAAVATFWERHSDRAQSVHDALASIVTNSGDGIAFVDNYSERARNRTISRLPLIVSDPIARQRILISLRREGISATTMYSRALPQIVAEFDQQVEYERLPGATALANTLITLPIHERLGDRDIDRMAAVLSHKNRELQ